MPLLFGYYMSHSEMKLKETSILKVEDPVIRNLKLQILALEYKLAKEQSRWDVFQEKLRNARAFNNNSRVQELIEKFITTGD